MKLYRTFFIPIWPGRQWTLKPSLKQLFDFFFDVGPIYANHRMRPVPSAPAWFMLLI
jgi:hypothetical protein